MYKKNKHLIVVILNKFEIKIYFLCWRYSVFYTQKKILKTLAKLWYNKLTLVKEETKHVNPMVLDIHHLCGKYISTGQLEGRCGPWRVVSKKLFFSRRALVLVCRKWKLITLILIQLDHLYICRFYLEVDCSSIFKRYVNFL